MNFPAAAKSGCVAVFRSSARLQIFVISLLLPGLTLTTSPVAANPLGGNIVHGDVTIGAAAGGNLQIQQSSHSAIIDWESFSIDPGELTQFLQPNSSAAVLNRVTGGNPSAIHGALKANGNVFVINPNGILVGPGGTIDVHGLVLSTLDVENGEFLAGGDMTFKGVGGNVTNMGRINGIGGDVFLIGRTVQNSGSIRAGGGTVGLAAGEEVLLTAQGNTGERLFVRAKGSGVSGTGILNDGTIEGAAVELKAHGNLYALAINNKGSVRATGAMSSGGKVYLRGAGGGVSNSGSIRATSSGAGKAGRVLIESVYAKVDGMIRAEGGEVRVTGTDLAQVEGRIDVSNAVGRGGEVTVEGAEVVLGSHSEIDASGRDGGGLVRVGGGFQGGDTDMANAERLTMEGGALISSDAWESGNGGRAILWSDGDTEFRGEITALGRGSGKGGFVEVSGREGLLFDGTVSTLAESGAHGTLLLDPKNLTISAAGASSTNFNIANLVSNLGLGHIVISTFDATETEAGHITVLDPLIYSSTNSLTLLAEGDLYIGNHVINRGDGNVNLVAGWNPAVRSLVDLSGAGGPDMDALIFDTPGSFGSNNGSVYVGLLGLGIGADRAVSVASRNGQTNVAGHDVNVWGPALTGGVDTGQQRYAQIGYNRRAASTAAADPNPVLGRIRVKAANDVSVVANKFEVGLLGYNPSGWTTGTTNTGNASFAQIGHGGERESVRGMKLSGEIIVEAGNDVSLLGGKTINNHAQIGHGGYENAGTTNFTATLGGDVTVDAVRDLILKGGLGYYSHAQIGHGAANLLLADFTESKIDVNAGRNIELWGGAGTVGTENSSQSRAQIGHGASGNDFVTSTGTVQSPGSGYGFKGDIEVDAGGSMLLQAGNYDSNNFALIGHGGNGSDGDHSGDVTVTAGNGLELLSGTGTGATYLFTQIGHLSVESANALGGDVRVTVASGNLSAKAGGTGGAGYNYTRIGHGGRSTGGTMNATSGKNTDIFDGDGNVVGQLPQGVVVQVLDGDIELFAGGSVGNYAQIGHGGHRTTAVGTATLEGDITVEASGNIAVGRDGVTPGQSSANHTYAQIGHGGSSAVAGTVWHLGGAITVEAGGSIVARSGTGSSSNTQIGHGGHAVTTDSTISTSPIIVRALTGDLLLLAGTASNSGAKIGHGGHQMKLSSFDESSITVEAGQHIRLVSPQFASYTNVSNSGTQIGHGGIGATVLAADNTVLGYSGMIDVTAGGKLDLLAGSNATSYNWSLIGHTSFNSSNARGVHHGDIAVHTGTLDGLLPTDYGLTIQAAGGDYNGVVNTSTSYYSFASIGHRGHTSGTILSGDILVDVVRGGIVVQGGNGMPGTTAANTPADLRLHGASIGHGGYGVSSGMSGDVRVYSQGDILLRAGTGPGSPVLIGHGGRGAGGTLTGIIEVISREGSLELDTTLANNIIAYAADAANLGAVYIGHGAAVGGAGARQGHILVDVAGEISFVGADREPWIGHRSANAVSNADVTIRARSFDRVSGDSGGQLFSVDASLASILGSNLSGGHLSLVGTGTSGLEMGGSMTYTSPNDFNLLSSYGVAIRETIQNAGTGDINVVAGWDPSVAPLHTASDFPLAPFGPVSPYRGYWIRNLDAATQIFSSAGLFGNNGGSVTVFNAIGAASVGSALGQTNVAGHTVSLAGAASANAYAQIGYSGAATGAINVHARNGGVDLAGGGGSNSYAHIGHGGTTIPGNRSGAITVVTSGNVGLTAGGGESAYAQMGHGGAGSTGVLSGVVTVDGAHDITLAGNGRHAYAQIGHGGATGTAGTYSSGDPNFILRSLSASGVVQVLNTTGAVSLTGGAGFENAYAQIGHGGVGIASGGLIGGDVTVEAGTGGVSLQGGLGSTSHALIGSGGYQVASTLEGAVRVDAKGSGTGDGIALRGGDGNHTYSAPRSGFSGAMIGNSSYNSAAAVDGSTHVFVQNGGLVMEAGDGYYSNVTIGHVGHGSGGAMNGLIDIDVVGGDILVEGGSKELFAFSQIGHGGWDTRNHGGDIGVTAQSGDITLRSGDAGTYNSAKIGHGTYGNGSVQNNTGAITVEATVGSVELDSRSGTYAYTQIGHGGLGKNSYMRGEFHDAISVTAGTGVRLGAGSRADTFAMIGHGGTNARGVFTGAVNVNAGAEGLIMIGGSSSRAFAQVGHGGYNEVGDIGVYTINAAPVTVNAGLVDMRGGTSTHAYSLIGHGGAYVNGSSGGATAAESAVSVTTMGTAATDGVRLRGGTGDTSYAMIGSGGQGGNLDFDVLGDVTVTSAGGGVSLEGGSTNAFALIGNGGHTLAGMLSGTTNVFSNGVGVGNDISLKGGTGTDAFAMIGQGGRDVRGTFTGAVNVTAGAGGLILAGGGTRAFAQVGHGGYNGAGAVGVYTINAAAVTVNAGLVDLRGGGSNAYAQIGHGGTYANGSVSGSAISLTTVGTAATGGVTLQGGTGGSSYAMIGSGGLGDITTSNLGGAFDASGDVTVTSAGGGISLEGTTTNAFALIGNGGHQIAGALGGTTTVNSNGGGATDGISLKGGSGQYGYANIGHATNNVTGSMLNSDTVVTILGGGLNLESGSGTLAAAAIGLQSRNFHGTRSGRVDVTVSGGDVAMTATTGTAAYVQIGNGGYGISGTGSLTGAVQLTVAAGTLTMNGGSATGSNDYGKHVMIGHGGTSSHSGDMSGSVTVDVWGDITMNGGTGGDGFTQIGHGGASRSGAFGAAGDQVKVISREGGLGMSGGNGNRAYAMIGNGGRGNSGTILGSVDVDVYDAIVMGAGEGADAFAQIGHGGVSFSGSIGSAADQVSVVSQTAGLTMRNGYGSNAFAMIGMGGRTVSGSKAGAVTVSTASGVLMDGTVGAGVGGFLQIGHGGYGSGGSTFSGAVSVTGSAVDSAVILRGGHQYPQHAYALIGHGGSSSAVTTRKEGAINVSAGSGGIVLTGGGLSTLAPSPSPNHAPYGFAQIGHGGTGSGGAADGAISVTTTNGGDIVLHGGGRQYTHAQIGHGGRSSVSGLQTGAVTVLSDGKVELRGSVYSDTGASSNAANETWAQIGHGGMFSTATFGGAISVGAQTGVLLESGASTYARAQVGHGGYQAGTNAGAAAEMVNAAVTVTTATGGVILDASKAGGYSLAMIGNGGTGINNATGTRLGAFRGDIVVDGGTGNVELHSGARGGGGAMIGNGGTSLGGNHSGKINVSAEGDLVMDLATSITNNTFARIGHGGLGSTSGGADAAVSGNMSGDICVQVGGAVALDATGGRNTDNHVQIGHGGSRVTGDFTGNITVVARGGDGIELIGGSGTGAYAQIGHGGRNTAGTMDGDVYVIAETGDINLSGGAADSYAMLGHGDGSKTSTGQRGGGMHIFASGDLTGTGGSGAANEGNVYIFHQNNNGLQPVDYLVGSGDGYQKVVNGNINLPGYVTADEGTMISGNLGFGLVQIVDSSATDYVIDGPDLAFDTSADFYLLTGGNITMLSSYQNQGSGGVTLVAGWNGVGGMIVGPGSVDYPSDGSGGFNYCQPIISQGVLSGIDFNDCETFGNDRKTLTIGSVGQTSRVSIGSAGGVNTFAAAGIEMFASDGTAGAATQLGFYGDGTPATGAINLRVKELGLVLNAGQATNAFVQIGHGGTFSTSTGGVNAAIDISFCAPGDVLLNAASGTGSYAQIGHGGNDWDGAKLGTVRLDGARDVILTAGGRDAYAQIGHGGAGVSDAYGTGEARGNIEIVNTAGKIGLYGGTGLNATAQVGHGGVAMKGPMSGEVTVEAGTGGVELSGNSGTRTYAMIGHGGYNIDNLIDGDVTVTTNGTAATDGIIMAGGGGSNSGAFLGNGIYQNNAAVNGFTKVSVLNGGIVMDGGTGVSSKVGIGHSNDTDNITMTGFVEVNVTEGGLTMTGGTGTYASATIGHEKNAGTATMSGYVDVDVRKGDITLTGGLGQYANATIGHAGRGGTSTSSGDVTVLAGDGDISITGGSSTVSTSFAVARIGHGIWESGTKTGIITVTAEQGDILVQGGDGDTTISTYNFAQIGHGGYGNGSTQHIVDQAIHVTATLGSVTVNGGTSRASFGQIGHGGLGLSNFFLGSFGGDVTVKAGGAVSVNGGTQTNTHAQIGNGGAGVKAPLSGNVLVEAGTGGIDLIAGGQAYSHALIGNGGYDIDNDVSGTTTVKALGTNASTDGIRLKGGNGEQAVAHIGHLHAYGVGAVSGSVEVTAAAGDIVVEAGDTGYFAHAQIGHGGRDSDSDKSGAIAVTAENGDVILLAGGNRGSSHYAHAQIGHGGYANGVGVRTYRDDIRVESVAGSVSMTGGNANYDYAQIGHGGTSASVGMSVTFSGKVDVLAAEDLVLEAGTADTTYVQIGHGGRRIDGSSLSALGGAVDASAITVGAGRDVLLSGGIRSNSGAKIGHGHNGQALSSFVENRIQVDAGRHVELVSAQLGTFTSMSSSGTQIGHGGRQAPVDGGDSGYSGDIVLNAGGKLDLIAAKNATTFNYALVGHTAYFDVRGNHSGNITVKTGTVAGHADYGIHIASGTRDDAAATSNSYYSFAGIGHHGHSNGAGGGDLHGDIVVVAERGGLTLKGGMNASSSTEVRLHAAQIGHGDYNSDGLKTGNIKVCIAEDILLENGSARQSPVQIGHGGYSHTGDITGWIEVSSLNGDIVLDSSQGGAATIADTQIGHGGYSSSGNFDGHISLAAAGDIRLTGGGATATHSQIGHGGVSSTGTFSGDLHLLAGGDFHLTGGGHSDGYAMVGHGSAGPTTSGERRGKMKLVVGGDTVLTDNLSGVRLGHGTTTAGGISDAGIALVTGTLDLSAHAWGVSDIANEMGQDGEVTFAVLGGDLLVDGGGASFDHGFDVSFVASGDVILATSIQNSGSGNVGVAAGWASLTGYDTATYQFDGSNGLTLALDFNNCLTMDVLEFDFGVLVGDDALWGQNAGEVFIGNGSQTSGVAFGSARGTTTALGHAVTVRGGDTTPGAYGLVGFSPSVGISPTGAIAVKAAAGGVAVIAGDQGSAYAQIGHRSLGALASSLSGDIAIASAGGLSLLGGDGPQASAQIGHGGIGATLTTLAGAIDVSVATDLELIGGTAAGASAQIGHGGLFTTAAIEGDVQVAAGGSIALRSLDPALSAYAKIGHGDDARGAVATVGGSGTRDGDLLVTSGADIAMENAIIGHRNSLSPATNLGGVTWIGVSRDDPTDPTGGVLEADAGSEFSGAEEVRFYLPRRGNNRIAAGAKINGVAYDGGALYEPWPVQRADEYTNFLQTSAGLTQPLEHDDIMGNGPAPVVPGGFAFYFHQIVLGGSFPPGPVDPGLPGGGDFEDGDGFEGPQEINYRSMFPDDRAYDDWLRDQEERFSRWGPFHIYYEGFRQYGYNGESIFELEE